MGTFPTDTRSEGYGNSPFKAGKTALTDGIALCLGRGQYSPEADARTTMGGGARAMIIPDP